MKLKCTVGKLAGQSFDLESSKIYVFGREKQNIDGEFIVLPSSTVSRKHCQIGFEKELPIIQDLKSANGIRVNKNKVDRARLKDGDHVQIGAFSFHVEEEGARSAGSTESDQTDKKKENQVMGFPM